VVRPGPFRDEQLAELVTDAEAVIVGVDGVKKQTLAAGKSLRVIAVHGTGTDNVDAQAAREAGVPVVNAPHTNAVAVAEYMFAALLALTRKVCEARASLNCGQWLGSHFMGTELYGKNLGIVGLGAIGRRVAAIGKGFGMDVHYCDVRSDSELDETLGARRVGLAELLSGSDVVTLHVPLLPETRHLISAGELALMRPTAYLVNLARGGVVDERALYEALVAGKLAGAVLDVFEREPVPSDWPMLKLSNVLCTPHIGGYTVEAARQTSLVTVENLLEAVGK
ncbi:MAG: phosphoglycerate dehydrogenase, partial [Methanocella sp.]